MKKFLLTLAAVLCCWVTLCAQQLTEQQAMDRALQYMNSGKASANARRMAAPANGGSMKLEAAPVEAEKIYAFKGPRPQSMETAILMLADVIEATSRSMADTSSEALESMIHKTILDKFMDGQFNESNLSVKELSKLEEAFLHSLDGTYHTRVKYPGQR